MAKYDYKRAKGIIDSMSGKGELQEAMLGMLEDWFWTAETVWEDGAYTRDLEEPDLEIGGISGSVWATPTLLMRFSDGSEVRQTVAVGEIGGGEDRLWMVQGCLSVPVQGYIEGVPCVDAEGCD